VDTLFEGGFAVTIAHLLMTNFAVLMAAILLLWAACVRMRDVSVIDSFWAFGMVMMAGLSFVQTDGSAPRNALLFGLCALWGLRLAAHLFIRWRGYGEDKRYKAILGRAMDKKGWSFARASLQMVFLLQAPLLFFVCLPVQLGQVAAEPAALGWQAALGAVVALTGIAFESVGDWQLTRFKADPASTGKVLDSGLWRYTRHPNYFGDACTWWGLWIIAAETGPGFWTILSPVFLTWLLRKWSGVPLLEHGLNKSRPGYGDYVRRTSAFVPWVPKS
jgi:steroid 5-alpha reductase family enzyme